MTKAIIIEDEHQAREALQKMLQLIAPQVQIINTADSLIPAKKLLEETVFDLVFLDIQLKDGTAFDLLDSLHKLPTSIIFTTAHSKYAIQAFKVHAIDYLLKPINPQELLSAVNRANQHIQDQAQLKEFLAERYTHQIEQKIILKTNREHHIVKINDIIHLKAEGAYTTFVTNEKSIFVSKNLKYYEEKLDSHHFLRIHQSHLININAIKKIKPNRVVMSNEDEVPFSVRKKATLLSSVEFVDQSRSK